MTPPRTILGVDPGMNETGIVLRRGDSPLCACVVQRGKHDSDQKYLIEIAEVLDEYSAMTPCPLVAVEGLGEPRWFMDGEPRPINVRALIGTAIVLGLVLGRFPHAVIVPPGGNGSGPLKAYPQSLVGRREEDGSFWHPPTRPVRVRRRRGRTLSARARLLMPGKLDVARKLLRSRLSPNRRSSA